MHFEKNLTFIFTAAKLNLGEEKFFYIGEKYKENVKRQSTNWEKSLSRVYIIKE